jgi:hypothetical protein
VEARPPRRYLDGTRVGSAWNPPSVRRLYPAREQWDIAPFLGPDGLVITEHAREVLGEHVSNLGVELLPLDFEGSRYWVINVLDVVDCLDLTNSIYPADRPWSIEKYSFLPERFTRSLCKLPQHRMGAPYVVEDAERSQWSFKMRVERNNLRGIVFKLVWEDRTDGSDPPMRLNKKEEGPPTPAYLELVEATPSSVVLRWPKLPDVDAYVIEWSRDGVKYWPVGEFACKSDQIFVDNSGQTICTYVDELPTSGKTLYRVRSCTSRGLSRCSEPTTSVQVDLDHGVGDLR